ncbi:hypothetical protein LCGC14_2143230, partial [marine sediment metagenome]
RDKDRDKERTLILAVTTTHRIDFKLSYSLNNTIP